jgi:hypothetical protein
MRSTKGAIGLSINTLVTIIISLVILSGGIILIYQFIGGAEEIKSDLDARTQEEIERLLVDQGKQVALPLHTATIQRGEGHVFGIGVLNIREEQAFTLDVEVSRVVNAAGEEIAYDKVEVLSWVLYNEEPFILDEFEHTKQAILVNPGTDVAAGQYIFNARIRTGDQYYGNIQKFYVEVS